MSIQSVVECVKAGSAVQRTAVMRPGGLGLDLRVEAVVHASQTDANWQRESIRTGRHCVLEVDEDATTDPDGSRRPLPTLMSSCIHPVSWNIKSRAVIS